MKAPVIPPIDADDSREMRYCYFRNLHQFINNFNLFAALLESDDNSNFNITFPFVLESVSCPFWHYSPKWCIEWPANIQDIQSPNWYFIVFQHWFELRRVLKKKKTKLWAAYPCCKSCHVDQSFSMTNANIGRHYFPPYYIYQFLN